MDETGNAYAYSRSALVRRYSWPTCSTVAAIARISTWSDGECTNENGHQPGTRKHVCQTITQSEHPSRKTPFPCMRCLILTLCALYQCFGQWTVQDLDGHAESANVMLNVQRHRLNARMVAQMVASQVNLSKCFPSPSQAHSCVAMQVFLETHQACTAVLTVRY